MLGVIVEKITAKTYYQYVQETIFAPCGMHDTGFYRMDEPYQNLATGYFEDEEQGGKLVDNKLLHGIRGSSAGGGWSTATDLLSFIHALKSDKLISAETRSVLWTPKPMTPHYGYGFQIRDHWVGHWGGFLGIEAFVFYFTNSDSTFVILSNYYDSALPLIGKMDRWYRKLHRGLVVSSPCFSAVTQPITIFMIFQDYFIIRLTAGSINREIVMKLQGVIPPFITPLDEDENIIERDVEKLTERLLEAGIRNIFLLGTMGEGPLIRDNEKEVLIRQTIAAAQNKATVIVNVSDTSTNKILANIETAAKCGADIVATTVPIYLPLAEHELIIKFFHDVAERSSLPIALYDIPKLVNTSIEIDTIWEISKEKHIIGLKDSSGKFSIFRELIYLFRERDDFGLVTGDEWTIDASLLVGADGFVPGIGCLAPELCLELYKACIAKNVEKASELQDKLLRLFKIYGKNARNWSAGIKEALKIVGVFSSNVVAKPMKPIDQKISEQVADILRDEGLIV